MAFITDELSLSGWLANYIDYWKTQSDCPKVFHLASGLTLLASACGSNVIFPGFGGITQWPNLYTLLIAPSGFYRKSTAVRMASKLATELDDTLVLQGEDTREQLLTRLKNNPTLFMPIDEFASSLDLWSREYMAGMKSLIVDLYDPKETYTRQTMKEKILIRRPAINILAGSTIDWLRDKLTEGDLRGGLMGRFLLFPGQHKEEDKGLVVAEPGREAKLVEFLKPLTEYRHAVPVDFSKIREPFNKWLHATESEIEKTMSAELIGFQSRIGNHTLKLIVLICISEYGVKEDKYIPDQKCLDQATMLSTWILKQSEQMAMTGFTKNKNEIIIQKLIGMARQNGGIERSTALRSMHITSKEFDQIIRTVIDRGEILIENVKLKNTTKTVYKVKEVL